MSNKTQIVLASITVIVAAGLMALSPSIIGNAQAELYANEYRYDDNYYQDDNRYSYDKKDQKSSHADIQKIKCVNSNINVNGIDITQIPQDNTAALATNEGTGLDTTNAQNDNELGDRINFERNLVNICLNVNVNDQIKVSPPEEDGACDDCFSVLTETQIGRLLSIVQATSIGAYCDRLASTPNSCTETDDVITALSTVPGITPQQITDIINCLVSTGVINQQCA